MKSLLYLPAIFCISLAAGVAAGGLAPAASDLPFQEGVSAFEQRRWEEAMGKFLEVLKADPRNKKAHSYVELIARQIESERRSTVRESRLALLANASQRLEENNKDYAPVDNAIFATTQAERRAKEERWHSLCEQARLERDLGHLLPANDLILRILAEDPSHAEAQRELSELQSRLRKALDHGAGLSMEERYAYQGFYSFGQADYSSALNAWQKVHALAQQSYSAPEAAKRVQVFRFGAYEKTAQDRVDEEKRAAELRDLFQRGVSLFEQRRFVEALDAFRQLAIREPEYPQLGAYIVQTEAAADQERARRLGEEKRREIERLVRQGVAGLEREQYGQAQEAFQSALKLDPSDSRARAYLTMVETEMRRRHDPKAAQLHYEAGLIAYASGRLDEAAREWRLTIRQDPVHEKALKALAKVQRELALSRGEP